MKFALTVDGFPQGGSIPPAFTSEGANRSPALAWSGAPPGTRSFVLIMDDPDAPGGTWNHWLLWNIPPDRDGLEARVSAHKPIHSGVNDFGKSGYGGPAPPRGHGAHRYFFRLFALDVDDLKLPVNAGRHELDRAMASHVLATAEYMGTFERK